MKRGQRELEVPVILSRCWRDDRITYAVLQILPNWSSEVHYLCELSLFNTKMDTDLVLLPF
jgi:hypothetical protein